MTFVASLLMLWLVSSMRIGTTASTPIVTPRGVCVTPGGTYQLMWESRCDNPTTQRLHVVCEDLDGTRRDIHSEERYLLDSYTNNCIDGSQCKLVSTLRVDSVAPGDAGVCYAYMVEANEGDMQVISRTSHARIYVQEGTAISLTENNVTMTLNQEFEVGFHLECDFDGAFEIYKDGESRALEHRSEPGPGGMPYLRVMGLGFPVIHFPDPSCRDEGRYHVIYRVSRNFQSVATSLYLQIRACDACCREAVTEVKEIKETVTPKGEANKVEPEPSIPGRPNSDSLQDSSSTVHSGYQAGIGGLTALVLILLFVCACLVRQNRRIARSQHQSGDSDTTAAQPLKEDTGV